MEQLYLASRKVIYCNSMFSGDLSIEELEARFNPPVTTDGELYIYT
jgi:hypothetical protein